MNTIKCQGCVQTDVLSGNHKTSSAVIVPTIEAPQKRKDTVRVTNKQKEKGEKDNSV